MARSQRPTLIVGLSILGVAAAFSAWPQRPEGDTEPRVPSPRVVRVATVEAGALARELRLPGVTRAARRATVSFTLPARITSRPVEVGDRLHAGQVIATLDDREFRHAELAARATVAELSARLEQALRDLDRSRRLAAARAATSEELEQSRAAVAALQAAQDASSARLEETRRLLHETSLVAPFDATVTAVHLEPGEWAGPGAPVAELSGRGAIEVSVEVPEAVRSRIAVGAPVRVDLPFLDSVATGRVTSVADATAGPGGLFPVEVTLDPGTEVIAGLAAEVVLTLGAEPQLTVPLGAVIDPGSARPSVFRISNGVAERIPVLPGRVVGDRLTVRAELAAGDRVAVSGHTSLADRDPVEVR